MDEWEERVRHVAHEIEQFLETHPDAADSLEGIATWWLSRQRIHSELAVVRAALDVLARSGVVTAAQTQSGQGAVYRLSHKRH